MQKLEVEAVRYLIKSHDFPPNQLKEVSESLKTLQDFLQYLGSNQYYSDSVNKRIFLLGIDADALMLKMEKVHLEYARNLSQVMTAIAKKKTPSLDKQKFAAFLVRLFEVEKELVLLQDRAIAITEEIKADFSKKSL